MNYDLILILILFTGAVGAITVVTAANHINICLGYLTLTASLSGVFLYLGNIYTAICLILLHSVSVVLIISFGIFACGFKLRIDYDKNPVTVIIAGLASIMIFVMMALIMIKSGFETIFVTGETKIGLLLTAKYIILFEIIAASILTAVTGTVFMTGRRK